MMRTWRSPNEEVDNFENVESKVKEDIASCSDKSKKKKKKPKLSMSDLVFLLQNTQYDEQELREKFDMFLKECPDGYLYRNKMSEMCKMIFADTLDEGPEVQEHINQLFRVFDKDGNGVVDFREFVLATDMSTKTTAEEKLKAAFKIYDTDNSGSISMDEFTEALTTWYAMEGFDKPKVSARKKAVMIFDSLGFSRSAELNRDKFIQCCVNDESIMEILCKE